MLAPLKGALGLATGFNEPATALLSVQCVVQGYDIKPEHMIIVMGWCLIPFVLLLLLCFVALAACALAPCRRFCPWVAAKWSQLAIMFVYFLHPMVTLQFLSAFQCAKQYEADEESLEYMRDLLIANMNISCYDSEHQSWMWAAGIGLVVWSFGIPAVFFWLLRKNIGGLESNKFNPRIWAKFAFLFDGYIPECYWWEIVFMVRKVAYLVLANLPKLSANSRVILVMALAICSWMFQVKSHPFDDRAYFALDRLEQRCSSALICLFAARLLVITVEDKASPHGLPFRDVLLYIPAFVFLMLFFGLSLYLLVRPVIFPIDQPSPWLPSTLAKAYDRRTRFSLTALEYEIYEPGRMGGEPTAARSYTNVMVRTKSCVRRTSSITSSRVSWGTRAKDFLHRRAHKSSEGPEKKFLLSIWSMVIDAVLQRHKIYCKEEVAEMCAQTFMFRFNCVFACCLGQALKNRVGRGAIARERSSTLEMLQGMGDDVKSYVSGLTQGKVGKDRQSEIMEEIDWSNPECPRLKEEVESLHDGVNLEELYDAVTQLLPRFVDPKQLVEGDDYLVKFSRENRGLLSKVCIVEQLFGPEALRSHRMMRQKSNWTCQENEPDSSLRVASKDSEGSGMQCKVEPESSRPDSSNTTLEVDSV